MRLWIILFLSYRVVPKIPILSRGSVIIYYIIIKCKLLPTYPKQVLGGNIVKNPYRVLGSALLAASAIFTPVSYFILDSVPLASLGISTIIIGFTCIALANTRPYISPEACRLILKTGMENTAALLEELGLRNKAVYLPSAMRDGHAQAIIPLGEDGDIGLARKKIPGRLIVRYGVNPEDMAIAVTTPGSINLDMLEVKPGPTSDEIEGAATYILTGVLDIADSVTVSMADNRIDVTVAGARLPYEDIWYYRCLGSPVASIIAAISSEAMAKPVRIKEESFSKDKSVIALEVLS